MQWQDQSSQHPLANPSPPLDFAKEKHTSQIIIKPSECFKGLESAALNTTIAAGPVHLGLSVGYGIKDGSITHAAKLAKSANGLDHRSCHPAKILQL